MNARSLRRLAADHGSLHSEPLPPNYLFPASSTNDDDLTQLDVLLAGPSHTPFAGGLFKLHLTIPPNYPQQPPTAHFRTPIFHPNVEPQTGGVCVETLKRDWDVKLTLRDILVVISCLLIQPNPDSALNAEAGGLIQDDYSAFGRRAGLMTSIHAKVPVELRDAVTEARSRGHITEMEAQVEDKVDIMDFASVQPAAPARHRRPIATARQRGTTGLRRSEGSPTGVIGRRRARSPPQQPFVLQARQDDIFGDLPRFPALQQPAPSVSDDDSMHDADQENDEAFSPAKPQSTPKAATPRRPQGPAIPLGELSMEDVESDDTEDDMDITEYPPSPRKSPSKSAQKPIRRPDLFNRPESSRDALRRAPNITPPQTIDEPLANGSPFAAFRDSTPSPRKVRIARPTSPGRAPARLAGLFAGVSTLKDRGAVVKAKSPSSINRKQEEESRRAELDAKLWMLCGQDVRRWNEGDFDEQPFPLKAARW
ncbi:hypothetical protein LTR78_007590 [Recurvomyces mirabilis]|uniref:Ubiquitin-conjugating enzyme E2 2 n=1 Tax=Recurvomyces mirabilis TaxID=574656 RepID=A0AAE0TSH4_9PEZI|nr:hypothetical protein LTR78_007590 [Recurvomyces mirabilis]KAK5159898.1 hypothetical protein LTS14_002004 [Recurvomyces mirabilis]